MFNDIIACVVQMVSKYMYLRFKVLVVHLKITTLYFHL